MSVSELFYGEWTDGGCCKIEEETGTLRVTEDISYMHLCRG